MTLNDTVTYLLSQGYSKVIRDRELTNMLIEFRAKIGKPLSKTGCRSCIGKAFFSLSDYKNYDFSRKYEDMKKKYKFVNPDMKYRDRYSDNKIITSENLTDDIAERMISRNPALISMFVVTHEIEEVEEVKEKKPRQRKKKVTEENND
jgi:hypothetical protein